MSRRDRLALLARETLGGVETPFESRAEDVVREVARRLGVEETFRRTVVAVDFDRCVQCGGCMVGCRYEAKNTLDRNYLRFAEEGGAVVHPEREATLLRRVDRGWEVETAYPGAWVRKRPELFRAEQVVLAAGVLGTLKLLFRSGLGGPNLGMLVRSNSETIVGAGANNASVDYSEGIAIGSSFRPNADTHIEPVRYPKGSSMMGLFSTVLVDGVKIVYPEGWALVLPDPELAITHIWAEGASDAEARRLVAIHAGQVAELTR